jgi:hypothetical protein
MSEPPPHPLEPKNPFGVFGNSFFGLHAFALIAGWQKAPAPPTWDAETIHTQLTAILDWVERQPKTGSPVPVASRRWMRRWPIVPRSHPADAWMQGIGRNVRFALKSVDEGALNQAQQVYANAIQAMDYLSAHLAEPHVLHVEAKLKGGSDGGKIRSDRYEPYRTQSHAEAKRIWRDHPHHRPWCVAGLILERKLLKPIAKVPVPSQKTIANYIAHLNPHPKRRRPSRKPRHTNLDSA